MQNQAIRNIFAYEYFTLNESTNYIMKKYKIFNVMEIIHFNKILMIHKISESMMKSDFQLDFTRLHHTVHRPSKIYMPFRTNLGKKQYIQIVH